MRATCLPQHYVIEIVKWGVALRIECTLKLRANMFAFHEAEDGTRTVTCTIPRSMLKRAGRKARKEEMARYKALLRKCDYEIWKEIEETLADESEAMRELEFMLRTGEAPVKTSGKNPKARHGETQDQPHCVKFVDPPNRKGFASFLFEVRQHGLADKRFPFSWPTEEDGLLFPSKRSTKRGHMSQANHNKALKDVREKLGAEFSGIQGHTGRKMATANLQKANISKMLTGKYLQQQTDFVLFF